MPHCSIVHHRSVPYYIYILHYMDLFHFLLHRFIAYHVDPFCTIVPLCNKKICSIPQINSVPNTPILYQTDLFYTMKSVLHNKSQYNHRSIWYHSHSVLDRPVLYNASPVNTMISAVYHTQHLTNPAVNICAASRRSVVRLDPCYTYSMPHKYCLRHLKTSVLHYHAL